MHRFRFRPRQGNPRIYYFLIPASTLLARSSTHLMIPSTQNTLLIALVSLFKWIFRIGQKQLLLPLGWPVYPSKSPTRAVGHDRKRWQKMTPWRTLVASGIKKCVNSCTTVFFSNAYLILAHNQLHMNGISSVGSPLFSLCQTSQNLIPQIVWHSTYGIPSHSPTFYLPFMAVPTFIYLPYSNRYSSPRSKVSAQPNAIDVWRLRIYFGTHHGALVSYTIKQGMDLGPLLTVSPKKLCKILWNGFSTLISDSRTHALCINSQTVILRSWILP